MKEQPIIPAPEHTGEQSNASDRLRSLRRAQYDADPNAFLNHLGPGMEHLVYLNSTLSQRFGVDWQERLYTRILGEKNFRRLTKFLIGDSYDSQ